MRDFTQAELEQLSHEMVYGYDATLAVIRQIVDNRLRRVRTLLDPEVMEREMYRHSGTREDILQLAVVPAIGALRAALEETPT